MGADGGWRVGGSDGGDEGLDGGDEGCCLVVEEELSEKWVGQIFKR